MFLTTVVLCVLFTDPAIALPTEGENVTSSDSQTASVKEVSQPPMTVQNAAPQEYIPPNYYTFNKGEPFYVEKDPLTGAIDFNRKTTPKNTEKVESYTSSALTNEKDNPAESDYFYDDQDFTEDGIDRKDGNIEGSNKYRPNDILQNPYKISPDLHQFLNLPVHYSSSDKFPLISSSYANTKVQGTGSSTSYSNHKYVKTSSTQSPSYYTMPTTKYTTLKPIQYSTTTIRPSTAKPTSTTTEEEEYENTDYNEYEEDTGAAQDNQAVPSEYNTYRPETVKYTVTTYRPTTFRFTTTTTTPKPSSESPTTEKQKQQVSIVTSLPLDVYYSTSQEQTTASSVLNAAPSTQTPTNITNGSKSNHTSESPSKHSPEPNKIGSIPNYNIPSEEIYHSLGEEPFRPIFGPIKITADTKNEGENQIVKNDFPKHKPEGINEFQRLPSHQNIRPVPPTLLPQMEPPRPDAPLSYFPEQPNKLRPFQQLPNNFAETAGQNPINRPSLGNIYERPPPPPYLIKDPINHPDFSHPGVQHNNQNNHPVYEGRPSERPIPSVKPRPPADIGLPNKSNFKVPSKIDSHFIKVTPDQENPSYSLQTSFSIGVPAPAGQEPFEIQKGQGVGQVLFPDNTPAETNPSEANSNFPAQLLRPPNNRAPVQSYQPNKPGYRQPIQIQARPPVHRLPNDDPQPPNGEVDLYPRPHWENHNKLVYSPVQNVIPKKEIVLPQNYPGLSRGKPENIQRPDLPNILPQFRPNAKVGHVDYRQPLIPGEIPREPLDTLQPPPLPKPQHLRINRNDDESEIDREISSGEMRAEPVVNRRSGAQFPRVTTLQMMQQNPHKKTGVRLDGLENRQSTEKNKPVFLVYPSAHGMAQKPEPEEVVVIGTRAQRPLPPANLEKDDLDSFPLDDNKNFPIPDLDRVDTPILKTKVPSKPLIKHDFPYPIVKPIANDIPEERILSSGSNIKEYTAFSPTPASSTEEIKDHDSEINIIPYLQDYMPFATKKPQVMIKSPSFIKKDSKISQKPVSTNNVISTTLNNSLATTSLKNTTEKAGEKQTENLEKNGSEMTVSATMYTQQRPANHKVPVTYTPSEPQPLGFQAPFMASQSGPESQGWMVVTDKNLKPAGEAQEESNNTDTDGNKFDIENFKPQLFGGFKPILPSSGDESDVSVSIKDKDVLLSKGDREERAL
ncbi:titin-like [Macrosteles quadrilineatus]|uniref:titin-like n=1 Tax=Macrosteles quadrilineatus TaxID=74068 RepID=UPI0023E27841|nr:titin-like [Macrosteles quadrilineatus]